MSAALRSALAAPGRLLLAATLLGVAAVGMAATHLSPLGAAGLVHHAITWLRASGAAGPAALAVLQVLVALSGAMPASLLGIAAGAVYGVVPGFLLAALGSLAGAVIAFALSRSLFRPAIERALTRHGRLRRLDHLLRQDGWKLVCLLRLSPVMPFSATSYLLGLSSLAWSDYLGGTLASLPALLGYVFLGSLTDSGISAWAGGDSPVRWLMLALGAVATLLLTLHLGRIVLQRQIGDRLPEVEAACGD